MLPPRLAALQLTAGTYRAGLKILVYGRFKTGKSYLAASAPGPIFALCNGEPGLIPYLDPKRGDVGLEIHSADDYYAALEFALKNQKDFATFVSDNDNLAWAQTMEDYEDSLNANLKVGETEKTIQGKDWRKIKGPRKAMLRALGHGKPNMVFTCWLKDTIYRPAEGGPPGVEAKLEILPAEIPEVEKTTVSLADLIFMTDVQKDRLSRPTNIHTVTYMGGRRPRTVSPEDLYTGKVWKFDAKKPVNVWDTVIAPFHQQWSEGGEEHLGVDPEQAAYDRGEMEAAFQQQEVGRFVARMAQMKTLTEFAKVYAVEMEDTVRNLLTPENKALVLEAKERRKKELSK